MSTEAESKAAILKMLKSFGIGDDKLLERRDVYWDVLSPLPAAAIVEACRMAACGELGGDGRFPPTTAELCIAIRGHAPGMEKKPFILRQRGDDAFVSSNGTLYVNGQVYPQGRWKDERPTPLLEREEFADWFPLIESPRN